MKTITISQPWASLLIIKDPATNRPFKTFETRSWPTKYRGPIAIHSSSKYPKGISQLVSQDPFASALNIFALEHNRIINLTPILPTGVILATATLSDCIPTHKLFTPYGTPIHPKASPLEWFFGDYSPNRFAFHLTNITPLDTPIPAKGKLGLWNSSISLKP